MNDNDPFSSAERNLINFLDGLFPERKSAQQNIVLLGEANLRLAKRCRRSHNLARRMIYIASIAVAFLKAFVLAALFMFAVIFLVQSPDSSLVSPVEFVWPMLILIVGPVLELIERSIGRWELDSGLRYRFVVGMRPRKFMRTPSLPIA